MTQPGTKESFYYGASGENSTLSKSPSRSERLKLKRSGSDSSVPGYYASLSGHKRKTRGSDTNDDDDGANAEALSALAKAPPKPSAEKKKSNSRKSSGTATRRKEEETAAALLGLFRSDSGPGAPSGHILPTSPPTAALVPHDTVMTHPGVVTTHVTALPYTYQQGGAPAYPPSLHSYNPYSPSVPAPKPKPAVKRQRSQSSRRSEVPDEPLLDIKLPEGNGPWEGIVVTLRHGKYKGKSANVLGLAKKKYRVQVEGLDYQLEFYPSYVGLPDPPQPDEQAEKSASLGGDHLLKRTATNASATNIVVASASPSQLQRVASGSSEGSKGSKATNTNVTTSLESYRPWIGKTVMVKRGKYQGRSAWVLGLASEKLRVVVENVEHQLEYYPTMFEPPQDNNQIAPQSTSVHLAIAAPAPQQPVVVPTAPPKAGLTRVASGASSAMPEAEGAPAQGGLVRTCSSGEGTTVMPAAAKPPTPSKTVSRCASSPPLC